MSRISENNSVAGRRQRDQLFPFCLDIGFIGLSIVKLDQLFGTDAAQGICDIVCIINRPFQIVTLANIIVNTDDKSIQIAGALCVHRGSGNSQGK